jgi:hypothetical protein
MIAPKTDPRWMNLLNGKLQHKFQVVAAAMMVSKCQRQVARDPSPQSMQKTLDELHAYFTNFENLVTNDLKVIFS